MQGAETREMRPAFKLHVASRGDATTGIIRADSVNVNVSS
jgi:hypothetical protein